MSSQFQPTCPCKDCGSQPQQGYENFQPYDTGYYSKPHYQYGGDSGSCGHPGCEQAFAGVPQAYGQYPFSPFERAYDCSSQYGQYPTAYPGPPQFSQPSSFSYQSPNSCSGACCVNNMPSAPYPAPWQGGGYEYAGPQVVNEYEEDLDVFNMSRRGQTSSRTRPRSRGAGMGGGRRRGRGRYYGSYGESGCGMM